MMNPILPQIKKSNFGRPICGYLACDRDGDGTVIIPTEHIQEVVGFLYRHDEADEEFYPLGTCFFISLIEGVYNFRYIITCKHVVKNWIDTDEQIYIRLNRSDRLDVEYVLLPNNWAYHPDKSVDLAVLLWHPSPKTTPPVKWTSMNFFNSIIREEILEAAKHTLKVGDELMFLGLFAQYAGYKRNFPVYRFGKMALITNEKIYGEYGLSDYYLAECQGYPGNSGSPAFIELFEPYESGNSKLFIVGIVAGFWPEQQTKQISENRYELYTHYGITALVPYQKIFDVLLGGDELNKRKKEVKEKEKAKAFTPASINSDEKPQEFTKDDMENALKKAFRPDKKKPDEGKSET